MTERELRLLAEQGAVRDATVTEHPDGAGYQVAINGHPLESHRQDVRRFAKLDTVRAVLAAAGVQEFRVLTTREAA